VGAVVSEAKGFLQDLRKKVDALDTQAVSDEVLAAIASLRRSLSSVEREIDTIAMNVRVASDDLKTMAGTGRDAMAQVRADAAEMLASLKSAAAKVDEVVQAAAPKVDDFLGELGGLARQLKDLAKEFEGLGPEAKRVVTELGHDLESIFANLQDASRNILDATEDLRAHPWKLANKPDGDEIAYENLRLSALTYMRAMGDMAKAAAELRLLASRPDAGTPEMRAKVAEALQAFDAALTRYKQAEERFSKLFQAAGPRAGR
jgi:chromosome segregation ATPase